MLLRFTMRNNKEDSSCTARVPTRVRQGSITPHLHQNDAPLKAHFSNITFTPIRTRQRNYNRNAVDEKQFRVNEAIKAPEIFLIDEQGARLGAMPVEAARALAAERGYDLIEVSPLAQPPVCKLQNFAQLKYQSSKHLAKSKSKIKKVDIKGVRLSLRISPHDLEMRQQQAKKFLSKGDKVKVEIVLRGREKGRADLAVQVINDFTSKLEGTTIEQPPARLGNRLSALVSNVSKN